MGTKFTDSVLSSVSLHGRMDICRCINILRSSFYLELEVCTVEFDLKNTMANWRVALVGWPMAGVVCNISRRILFTCTLRAQIV
jgi:hypothetical protein